MRTFQFQIVLTEECNLKCDYCYMNKKPNIMSREVFDKHYEILPKLMKEYGADQYVAGYFGGEPLMNWNLIELTAPLFCCDERCSHAFLATNGLLLDQKKREYLNKYKVQLSISFDGLWNDHNRKLSNGKGTLQEYIKLKDELDIHSCKVMVSPNRAGGTMVENYRWFVEEFDVPSPDFTLVRDDVWHATDVDMFRTEIRELTNQNIMYIRSGKESLVGWYGLYFLDTWFGKRYGKRKHGCFAGRYGMGFMPDGMIYPCARFGSEGEYPVWDSMTGEKQQKTFDMFMSPEIYNPETYQSCQQCNLYTSCNAGCTYSQLKHNIEIGGKEVCSPIPSLCELFKIVYSEMARIVEEVGHTQTFKNIVYNLMRSVG